nr:hypothetical protein [Flectobacillus sp.]
MFTVQNELLRMYNSKNQATLGLFLSLGKERIAINKEINVKIEPIKKAAPGKWIGAVSEVK